MSRSEDEARRSLTRVARRLDSKGILTATDGNLSVRLEDGSIVITPSGCCKGMLEAEELVLVRSDGTSSGTPSSEIALHRAIYEARADVHGVVHAHPPYATAYAVAGIALDRPILSEVVLTLGRVPVVPYARPTMQELAESVRPHLGEHSALLLRHHGAVVFAESIERAGFLMETLEHVAQIDFRVRALGSDAVLGDDEVEALQQIRRMMSRGRTTSNFPR